MTFLQLQNYFNPVIRSENNFHELIYFLSKKVKNPTDLILLRNEPIDFDWQNFEQLIIEHFYNQKPLAYITNIAVFANYSFYVNENVLIPRPETAIVLNKFIDSVKKTNYTNKVIVDVCTGSGCLGIVLAKTFKSNFIYGTDVDHKALKVAKTNQKKLEVTNIEFLQSNYLNCFKQIKQPISYLICNPPYIAKNDLNIAASVKNFEPNKALYAQKKGLQFYIDFANFIMKTNNHPMVCAFEFGFNQYKLIQNVFMSLSRFYKINYFQDDNNLWRGVILVKKSN